MSKLITTLKQDNYEGDLDIRQENPTDLRKRQFENEKVTQILYLGESQHFTVA